jgi:hypothetical protein
VVPILQIPSYEILFEKYSKILVLELGTVEFVSKQIKTRSAQDNNNTKQLQDLGKARLGLDVVVRTS